MFTENIHMFEESRKGEEIQERDALKDCLICKARQCH